MAMVNVNREVTDSFYRYKMPRLIAKVEGKGNGIKTVIVNMVDIAKALSRPASYPCKYFGCELGAQTQIDSKNERYIVNGAHEAQKLQELLDGFIKKFVLCPECENPETILAPNNKKKIIAQNCVACGHHNATVDMTHKVTTHILNHPPEVSESAAKNYADKRKQLRQREAGGDGDSPSGEADEDDNFPDLSASDAHHLNHHSQLADEDWSEDTSEDAVAKRQAEGLTEGVKGLTLTQELEKTPMERQEMFFNFVEEKKKAGKLEEPGCDKEIHAKAVSLDIADYAPSVLVGILFTDAVIKEIKLYKTHFFRFLFTRNPRGELVAIERAQRQLIGGLEMLIDKYKSSLLPKVDKIFYTAYDNNLLSEETVKEWAGKVSKKFVSRDLSKAIHDKAAPFLKWLEEAEESSEEEEEDEDEEDIFSRGSGVQHRPAAAATNGATANGAHAADDIDIDDI